MVDPGSITCWLTALKQGDERAAEVIWQRYCARLVELARKRLRPDRRREADEEDVVQNAFCSFFRGVAGGRFPELEDRDNLWRLLVTITARKACDEVARQNTKKRGGGTVRTESRIFSLEGDVQDRAMEQLIGDEPTPDFAVEVAEQFELLLDQLGEESLRKVALWRMEGLNRDEIAQRLGCSRRTVARKLDTIRLIWRKEKTP
jgi:RNA polymerase sigma factor (sigma-70 family)